MTHRIFVASSREALPVTEALVSPLSHQYDAMPWYADVFVPGSFTIEPLLKETELADFAVFVLAPDDIVALRGTSWSTARDNVVFELGLFLSRLGRERCFFLMPKDAKTFRLPTDLHGINPLFYDTTRARSEPKAALAAAVADLNAHLRRLIQGDGTTLSLSGRWTQNWKVSSARYPAENPEVAIVTQTGTRFAAISSAKGRPFVVAGEVARGNIITGTWSDRAVGATYFGAFQLVIDPFPNRMIGKWVGFASDNQIKSGDWEWALIENPS